MKKHKRDKPGAAAAEFVRKTLNNYSVAEYLARNNYDIKGEMRIGQKNFKTVPADAERD